MQVAFTPPKLLINPRDCCALLLASQTDKDRLISTLANKAIPVFSIIEDDVPAWTNEKLIKYLDEPRQRQVVVFGSISDPEIIATTSLALEIGFEVFAIITNPDLRNAHNLLAWMRLRDNSVKVLSMKQLLAEFEMVDNDT